MTAPAPERAGPTGGTGHPTVVPGHVSVSRRALQRLAVAVVAESWHLDRGDVRVEASDDAGELRLRVAAPVRVPALGSGAPVPEGGVVGLVRGLQRHVSTRVRTLSGQAVSRVDVTVTGGRVDRVGRVS